MDYSKVIHISIRAYYKDREYSTYYRDMRIEDIGKWLCAHNFTHPNVGGYTISIRVDENEIEE